MPLTTRPTRMQGQRPMMGSRASNSMGTGMFRNRSGRAGGGGSRGMGEATGYAGAAAGALGGKFGGMGAAYGGTQGTSGVSGAGTAASPYFDPLPGPSQPVGPGGAGGAGGVAPGAAAGALASGPTTYTAENDPLLMENVENLRGRLSADVTEAQKQKARADISTGAESERKKLATMAARSGGAGAMNEMAGDLSDKTMRTTAGAMTDIGIEAEKRKDALVLGGQGIYAAPGGRNLQERGFLADVDARLASQALQRDQFNAGNYWQGMNFNEQAENNDWQQAMDLWKAKQSGGYGGGGGYYGGGGGKAGIGSY